jgi:hypothetical protein
VTSTPSGASAGNPGGAGVAFTGFAPTTSWTELYWGPSSAALPGAGLDGSLHAMPFSGISGTTATWAGTTSWTNPSTGLTHTGVPIQMRITITGLGATPWVLSTSIPQLDPGVGTGIGAVVNNVALADFSFNTQFLADIPTDGMGNFIAINSVQNGGNQTRSSYTGGFYSRVP